MRAEVGCKVRQLILVLAGRIEEIVEGSGEFVRGSLICRSIALLSRKNEEKIDKGGGTNPSQHSFLGEIVVTHFYLRAAYAAVLMATMSFAGHAADFISNEKITATSESFDENRIIAGDNITISSQDVYNPRL